MHENSDVHFHGPVPDIKNVHIHPFLHHTNIFRYTGIAHHLRQACNAGFHFMTVTVIVYQLIIPDIVAYHMWPGADDGHIAQQYIDELWQFVEVMITQEMTHRGNAFVVFHCG